MRFIVAAFDGLARVVPSFALEISKSLGLVDGVETIPPEMEQEREFWGCGGL